MAGVHFNIVEYNGGREALRTPDLDLSFITDQIYQPFGRNIHIRSCIKHIGDGHRCHTHTLYVKLARSQQFNHFYHHKQYQISNISTRTRFVLGCFGDFGLCGEQQLIRVVLLRLDAFVYAAVGVNRLQR